MGGQTKNEKASGGIDSDGDNQGPKYSDNKGPKEAHERGPRKYKKIYAPWRRVSW